MVGRTKTLAEMKTTLSNIIESYRNRGINVDELEQHYKDHGKARMFLKRNDESHHLYDHYAQLSRDLKEYRNVFIKIQRLKTSIRKRENEEQHLNGENINQDQQSTNVIVNPTEAASRIFLALYERYSSFFNETPSNNSSIYETINHVTNQELQQALNQTGKTDVLTTAQPKLHELQLFSIEHDGSMKRGSQWHAFWHFYFIKDAITPGTSVSTTNLFRMLFDNLKDGLFNMLRECKRKNYISICEIDEFSDVGYGSRYNEFCECRKAFFSQYYFDVIEYVMENEVKDSLVSDIIDVIQIKEHQNFSTTLEILSTLHIFDINQQYISQGQMMSFDTVQWLNNNTTNEQDSSIQVHDQCQNCKRKEFLCNNGIYNLRFHTVSSNTIRLRATFKNVTASTGQNSCNYILCNECNKYLVEKSEHPKYIWPSFYWHLISGSYKDSFNGTSLYYHMIYPGSTIWRFIPKSMRLWWIDEIQNIPSYNGCNIDNPPSIFEDRTMDLKQFRDDYNSAKLSRVIKAMNNINVINRNVLCPWSCSASCHDAGNVPLDLMIQRMLPKIIIKLYSDHKKYKLVQFSWNKYLREKEDDYDMILLNKDWMIKPTIILNNEGIQVLTCKYHANGHDKLTLFPPRCIEKHILNASQPDQLAHCVKAPRIAKPTKAKKYNTTFSMVQCQSSFAGIDTMDISTNNDFSITSELLSQHESATIIGRDDMGILLQQKIKSNKISPELVESYCQNAKDRYSKTTLIQHAQGSTYVGFEDIIKVHLFQSSDEKKIQVMMRDSNNNFQEVYINRSWPVTINMLQTEDFNGYGTQFCSIPSFNITQTPSALTWSIYALVSSCKELWHIIDSKPTPFHEDGWEGWILTNIQRDCFPFHTIYGDSKSPFKKLTSLTQIASKINKFIPNDILTDDSDNATSFYKLHIDCFHALFDSTQYSRYIKIFSSTAEVMNDNQTTTTDAPNIIIIVGSKRPSTNMMSLGSTKYEMKVFCHIKSKQKGRNPSSFQAIRYMRHGSGFKSWWKQNRNDAVTTQCINDPFIQQNIEDSSDEIYLSLFILLYVIEKDVNTDVWRNKFFKSMGGKTHIMCQCCLFPLIPTNSSKENKKNAM